MLKYPFTFAVWIILILVILMGKYWSYARRRARSTEQQASENNAPETPTERRIRIEKSLITQKVMSSRDGARPKDSQEGNLGLLLQTTGGRSVHLLSEKEGSLEAEFVSNIEDGQSIEKLEEGLEIKEIETDDTDTSDCEKSSDLEKSETHQNLSPTPRHSLPSDVSLANSCEICLTQYEVGDEVSMSPNKECTHAFHKDCIADWLMKHSTCPCCRRNYLCDENFAEKAEAPPSVLPYS